MDCVEDIFQCHTPSHCSISTLVPAILNTNTEHHNAMLSSIMLQKYTEQSVPAVCDAFMMVCLQQTQCKQAASVIVRIQNLAD